MTPHRILRHAATGLVLAGLVPLVALAQAPEPATPAAPRAAEPSPSSRLTAQLFYELMLAEFAAQHGDARSASVLVLSLARREKDPQLFERAMRLAWQSRSGEQALQTARAWVQAEPHSATAARAQLQTAMNLQRANDTAEPLRALIANTPAHERAATIDAASRAMTQLQDKKAALTAVEQAIAPYTRASDPASAAAAWEALARLRWADGDANGALTALEPAQQLRPTSLPVVALALELMDARVAAAEKLVQTFLQRAPAMESDTRASADNVTNARLAYARVLAAHDRVDDATVQMERVTQAQPANPEVWLLLGALQQQGNRVLAAQAAYEKALAVLREPVSARAPQGDATANPSHERAAALSPEDRQRMTAQAQLGLAQLALARDDRAGASQWLDRVDRATLALYPPLLLRQAQARAQLGQGREALGLMQTLPAESETERRAKAMAVAQLQRQQQLPAEAHATLSQALAQHPDAPDLLYEQALVAEVLGRHDEMEQLLRRVIALTPDQPQAYNALGYSMVDRNVRLAEGKALIAKALEITPNDPFIRDSLGWAEFRQGNLAEARRILQQALLDKPDAEIAAHLGEVLWALGERDQALTTWRQGRGLNRDSATLQSTLKRLGVVL